MPLPQIVILFGVGFEVCIFLGLICFYTFDPRTKKKRQFYKICYGFEPRREKTNKKHNKNKTITNIIMFELLFFFCGLIGCALLIGRICEEGDYND